MIYTKVSACNTVFINTVKRNQLIRVQTTVAILRVQQRKALIHTYKEKHIFT